MPRHDRHSALGRRRVRVPLSEFHVGYGQVAAKHGTSGGHFYFTGFRAAFEPGAEPELPAVLGGRVALLALSMDPLIRVGNWQIVGNQPGDERRIPWPTYKVATAPDVYAVTDQLGNLRQRATHDQEVGLRYLTVIAPIRFENTLIALNGLADWRPEFDDLLIPLQRISAVSIDEWSLSMGRARCALIVGLWALGVTTPEREGRRRRLHSTDRLEAGSRCPRSATRGAALPMAQR